MGFWQLLVFINVIEYKSFSGAAKACGLAQPTVSSHIKQLENHLGCILIDRIGKKAIATKAGEILFGYAKRLIALQAKAEAAISDFLGEMKGSLAVGGSTIPGVYILPELMAAFRQDFPNVVFLLDIDSTDSIIRKLNEGQTEIGIVGSLSEHKSIHQKIIISDEMMLIVPKNHKWSKRDQIGFDSFKKEPFIKRENGSGTWNSFRKGLKNAGFDFDDVNVVSEIRDTNGVIAGIKGQLGVSVLSPLAVSNELKSNELHALRITGVDLKRSFFLTWSSKRSMSPIAELFKSFIERTFQVG
ncbi:MAG: LysR family transcriptional regulator [Proteobacteria bacterium]|nr:LysR family transcriptional regulator [Pseudomonadota bacterium]